MSPMMQKIMEWGTLSSLNQKFKAENQFLKQKFGANIEDIPFGSTIINQNTRTLGDKILPIAALAIGILGGTFGLSSLLTTAHGNKTASLPVLPESPTVIKPSTPQSPIKPIEVEGIINWSFDPNKPEKPKIDIELTK